MPGALQAEELLDLAPDDDREVGGQDEQDEQDGPEARAGQAALADTFLPSPAAGTVEPVPAIDRRRIVRGRVLEGVGAPGRLDHPGTINGRT
jgi:hypothetical protein